jgi:serine/threonine protein kinase
MLEERPDELGQGSVPHGTRVRGKEESGAALDDNWRLRVVILFSKELVEATEGFVEERRIGSGASGDVFVARPISGLGNGLLAVKRLREDDGREDADGAAGALDRAQAGKREHRRGEFLQEIQVLGACNHPNLLPLLAFSAEPTEPVFLVFPLMTGGNLEDKLLLQSPAAARRNRICSSMETGKKGAHEMFLRPLTWQQRLRVVIGAARALEYLHSDTTNKPPIIHRDVKAANILLDESLNARLCDAGLARLSPELLCNNMSHVSSAHICGTHGFVDPAYQQTGRLDASSDGYALGVCLLMCITGWPALDTRLGEPVLVNRCHELLTFSATLQTQPPSDHSLREIADVNAAWPCEVLLQLLPIASALLHPLRARRTPMPQVCVLCVCLCTCVERLALCELTAARGLPQTLHALEAVAHRHSLLSTLLMQGEVGHEDGHRSPGGEREKKECVMCMERLRQVRLRCGHAGILVSPDLSLSLAPLSPTHIPHARSRRARAFVIYAFAIRLWKEVVQLCHALAKRNQPKQMHTPVRHIFCDIRLSSLLLVSRSAVRSVLPTSSRFSVSCMPRLRGTVRGRCRGK